MMVTMAKRPYNTRETRVGGGEGQNESVKKCSEAGLIE
jgi:hypothetical protein